MALKEEMNCQGNWLFRYRSILPLVILVIGTLVYVHTKLNLGSFILEGTPYLLYYEMSCLAVGLLGLFVRIYTVGHTPDGTSGRNTAEGQVAEQLNTTGIYSIVRHPLYLGNFLMWLSIGLLTANFWFVVSFIFMYWVYYERIMFAEEQFLQGKFGDAYTAWAAKTPAFIPCFSHFVAPKYSFSWKKILKKEKNGLFALFLIFCFFNVLGCLLQENTDFNYFLMIATALTLLMYAVLKYLKKCTSVLRENR